MGEWPEPEDTGALVLASVRNGCSDEKIWARTDDGWWKCLCKGRCTTVLRWEQLMVIGEAIAPLPRRLWRRRR